jgi:hypothetical protein
MELDSRLREEDEEDGLSALMLHLSLESGSAGIEG